MIESNPYDVMIDELKRQIIILIAKDRESHMCLVDKAKVFLETGYMDVSIHSQVLQRVNLWESLSRMKNEQL